MLQQPPSAIPPHIQAQIPPRGGTPTYPHGPPGGYPPPSYSSSPPPPVPGRGYNTPPPGSGQPPGYSPSPGPGLSHGPGPHAQPPPHGPSSAQALPHTQLPHAQQPPSGPAAPVLPEALAALPEEQKVGLSTGPRKFSRLTREHLQALIMRVIAMSREEVYQMPPAERENIIKLVRLRSLLVLGCCFPDPGFLTSARPWACLHRCRTRTEQIVKANILEIHP